ncbi:hypothetical protein [Flavobacterium sp. N2038]|uniref:hypothetical protein n=1 Tax=Flavobacterium sp. N2038 TaxID=2986829 RepID=UPI002224C5FB|nr:hypothetical protein [Flavobacterium sp. N2038]
MQEILEIKELNTEDIKFLKGELKKTYVFLFCLSLFSIVLPGYLIYLIFTNPDIEDGGFAVLMVIIVFGFWTYVGINGMIKSREEKQGLLLQKKIEGNVKVVKKEIVTNEGHDSDTLSHEITIYSQIEEKYRNISIYKKDYDKIEVGDFMRITYFTDNTSIKALIFKEQNLKYKSFTSTKAFDK